MNLLKNISRVLLLSLLFCGTVLAAEYSIDFFTTKADGNNVVVEWRCSTEKSVVRYEIERSTDGQNFRLVNTVDSRGAYQLYRYVDSDVLMKSGEGQPKVSAGSTYYRLKIIGSDNSTSYSSLSTVVHNVSSVRRTWGMIKEMFK